MRIVALFILTLAGWSAARAEHWQLQYFYDHDQSSLVITDLQFPSPERGVAVGYIETNNRKKATAVVTGDGGAHWSLVRLKEEPVSLFFLDDSLGWMVSAKHLWQTREAGRSWRKVAKLPSEVLKVYFLDSKHGFAAGGKKSVYETRDGGRHWHPVEAALTPNSDPDDTVYNCIAFANKEVGMITGFSSPQGPSGGRLPDWLEPEKAQRRRERPSSTITLDTRDGGATWKPSETTMLGQVTRVRLLPNGDGLGLISFFENYEWPSEVVRLDWKTGASVPVFRDKERAITDLVLMPGGVTYLAGHRMWGRLRRSPIPSKLEILKSEDLSHWKEMDVDYRAVARHAVLAAADPRNIWVATDTGMILKLVP